MDLQTLEEEKENGEDKDKDCRCAPGQDKEVIFNRETCLSTDRRFLWDYEQGLLAIDGRIASSGYISSGKQLEGAYFAPLALGLGSFNFTPPSGYGGIVYRGGSIFYYWNDSVNAWEEVDFGPVTQEIDVAHNGLLIGTRSVLNFQDSASVTWTINDPGTFINISASDGSEGPWQEDQNANGFSIYNLYQLNGINVSDYLTNLWNQDVNANNFNLNNVGNLSVNGQITYQGKSLDQYIQDLVGQVGGDLWSLNVDGSIYRESKVYVYGPDLNPMEIVSGGSTNFLYLDLTDAGSGGYAAYAAKSDGEYMGELGFSFDQVELWNGSDGPSSMVFTAIGNQVFFPGLIGIGIAPPQLTYPLDIWKANGYNARFRDKGNFSAILIDHDIEEGGQSCLAFWSGGHERAVIGYDSDEDNLIFWTGENDAVLSTLCCSTNSYVGVRTTDPTYPLDVNGDIHTSGCVYIGDAPVSLCAQGNTLLVNGAPISASAAAAPPVTGLQYNNNGVLGASDNARFNGQGITLGPGYPWTNRPLSVIGQAGFPFTPPTIGGVAWFQDDRAMNGLMLGMVAEGQTALGFPQGIPFSYLQAYTGADFDTLCPIVIQPLVAPYPGGGVVGIGKYPISTLDVNGTVNATAYFRNGSPMMLLTVDEHRGIFEKLNEMDSLMRVMRSRMNI